MLSPNISKRFPKTKIVCTLGPATESEAMIESLVREGMSIARLNMSHSDLETHKKTFDLVRRVSRRFGMPVGIMVDVPGPKYRTGPTVPGVLEIKEGDSLTLTSRDIIGDDTIISVRPPGIHRDAIAGGSILLDDGLLKLTVEKIEGEDVRCKIVAGGRVTERRGVVTPGRSPSQPSLDENAKGCLAFAAEQGADFVALSMVNTAKDVQNARGILQRLNSDPLVISKIESVEALDNIDDIIDASDSIMVARGDMGVHVSLYRIPVIQKSLITKCNAAGKPVITATQMLESMVRSQMPTRAEVTDVANAIYDGTDAIMLSGETSVGAHPIDAVHAMVQTAAETEHVLPYEDILLAKSQQTEDQRTDDAISFAAARTAHQLDAALIVAFTESGSTAGRVSKYRPKSSILALTPYERIRNRLTLNWGTIPVMVPQLTSGEDFFEIGEEQARKIPGVQSGDCIVLVAGLPMGVQGSTNLLRAMNIDS